MEMLVLSVTSVKNIPSACVAAQQPIDEESLKIKTISPFAAAVDNIAKWRVRATPPIAPNKFPVNRQTVRQQDSDDKHRQWVMAEKASADNKSLSATTKHDPQRRI